jgi:hypothetical protein
MNVTVPVRGLVSTLGSAAMVTTASLTALDGVTFIHESETAEPHSWFADTLTLTAVPSAVSETASGETVSVVMGGTSPGPLLLPQPMKAVTNGKNKNKNSLFFIPINLFFKKREACPRPFDT